MNLETAKKVEVPEAAFIDAIGSLGGTRSGKILEALKKMNLAKRPGEAFPLADAHAQYKKVVEKDIEVESFLWDVLMQDQLYGGPEGVRKLQVSRAIELLG